MEIIQVISYIKRKVWFLNPNSQSLYFQDQELARGQVVL